MFNSMYNINIVWAGKRAKQIYELKQFYELVKEITSVKFYGILKLMKNTYFTILGTNSDFRNTVEINIVACMKKQNHFLS